MIALLRLRPTFPSPSTSFRVEKAICGYCAVLYLHLQAWAPSYPIDELADTSPEHVIRPLDKEDIPLYSLDNDYKKRHHHAAASEPA
jgi:hypothetical protein